MLLGGVFIARNNLFIENLILNPPYEISFNILNKQKYPEFRNILHHGSADNIRRPAIWIIPHTTRLHVRVGRVGDWNAGCDTNEGLPLNHLINVKLRVQKRRIEVLFNNHLKCAANYPTDVENYEGPMWISNPWSVLDFW